jgi:hypothetical protein
MQMAAAFVVFVALPMVMALSAKCYHSSGILAWYWNCPKWLMRPLNYIPLLGAIATMWLNYKTKTHSIFWYFIPSTAALILSLNALYIIVFGNFNPIL